MAHTRLLSYAGLREEAANDGRPFRRLIYVKPEERLDVLVDRLTANEISSAPCLTTEPDGMPLSCIELILRECAKLNMFCNAIEVSSAPCLKRTR